MFEVVKEIPVTFVPHDLDLWAVGATLFAASASLVVGALAYRTGRQASLIAKESASTAKAANDLQADLHTERISFEYGRRLDDALARLFTELQLYIAPLAVWLKEAESIETRNARGHGPFVYPDEPPTDAIEATFEVAFLFAKNGDIGVLKAMNTAVSTTLSASPSYRTYLIKQIMTTARIWRVDLIPPREAILSFRLIAQDAETKAGDDY